MGIGNSNPDMKENKGWGLYPYVCNERVNTGRLEKENRSVGAVATLMTFLEK